MTPAEALPYAFLAWLALTFGTYAGIRVYLHRRGEPEGWRFNHHGAHAFPGHLTFYEREGGHAVRFRSTVLFPLFWKVQVTPEPGAYLDPETVKRAPVWSAIPWAFRWMTAHTEDERARGEPAKVWAHPAGSEDARPIRGTVRDAHGTLVVSPDPDRDREGLVCMFCGADGFQTQDDLEDHIDSHPYTARRGDADD